MGGSLSLVVPVFNEEENLEKVINELEDYFSEFEEEFEIIFVDDGSSDRSSEIICLEKTKEMRLVQHPENRGYGEALKTGFEEAKMDLIGYIDGDGQFNIEDMDKLLKIIKDCDIAIGSRTSRTDSFDRIVVSKAFNIIVRKYLGLNFRDIDCGIKIFRRDVLEEVELSTRRTVDAELLAKASRTGFHIKQTEVEHRKREGGKSEAEGLIGVRLGLILVTVKEIIQIKQELR